MQKIKTVIVDDEEFSVIDIKEHLESYDIIDIIGVFSSGNEGLEGIHNLKPELVFVDIEMPGLNGFEMLSRLQYNPVIIFCTGHGKYALDGYAFDPSDFIVKPLSKIRFQQAMEKAIRDIHTNNFDQRSLNQQEGLGFLLLEYKDLHGDDYKTCIWPGEILYVSPQEDNANYIDYFLKDERVITVKKTLKKALKELGDQFVQVHKSFLVNSDLIYQLVNHDTLVLRDEKKTEVPVSRGNRKMITEMLRHR